MHMLCMYNKHCSPHLTFSVPLRSPPRYTLILSNFDSLCNPKYPKYYVSWAELISPIPICSASGSNRSRCAIEHSLGIDWADCRSIQIERLSNFIWYSVYSVYLSGTNWNQFWFEIGIRTDVLCFILEVYQIISFPYLHFVPQWKILVHLWLFVNLFSSINIICLQPFRMNNRTLHYTEVGITVIDQHPKFTMRKRRNWGNSTMLS